MLKKFTKEGRFECGLDELVAGKAWAFVPVLAPERSGSVFGLGVAVANEPGYYPVPLHWCHADTWDEAQAHAVELNREEGISEDAEMRIVCSSMAAGKVRQKPKREEPSNG